MELSAALADLATVRSARLVKGGKCIAPAGFDNPEAPARAGAVK